jgi:glutamine amidotransferase
LLFLLAVARIDQGEAPNTAMQTVLYDTQAMMATLGIAEPLRFAAALSDGQQLLAFRFASDDMPPTLYVGHSAQGHVVASEPLDACPEAWQSVPANSWVRVDAGGVTLHG